LLSFSWNQHPKPTGLRRATPPLLFQHPPGHPPLLRCPLFSFFVRPAAVSLSRPAAPARRRAQTPSRLARRATRHTRQYRPGHALTAASTASCWRRSGQKGYRTIYLQIMVATRDFTNDCSVSLPLPDGYRVAGGQRVNPSRRPKPSCWHRYSARAATHANPATSETNGPGTFDQLADNRVRPRQHKRV
jgi:hypothetical protein